MTRAYAVMAADLVMDTSAYMMWSPIPHRPWGVHWADGRIIRRFDTAAQAFAFLGRCVASTRKTWLYKEGMVFHG